MCELRRTVPGTKRSCHYFVPNNLIHNRREKLNFYTTVFLTHSLLEIPAPQNETLESRKCNHYITCCFKGFQCLVLIEVVKKTEKDLTREFLHSHGSSGHFHWLRGDDRRYIPLNKVIMKIQTLLRQQMEEHISSLKRKTNKLRTTLREQVFKWWNFICFF